MDFSWPWDAIVSGGLLALVLDRGHAALMRHREYVRHLEHRQQEANVVSEDECTERRAEAQARWDASCATCRTQLNGRLDDGDSVFLWVEAALRVLLKRSGVEPQEIEAEMTLLRKGRRRGGHA